MGILQLQQLTNDDKNSLILKGKDNNNNSIIISNREEKCIDMADNKLNGIITTTWKDKLFKGCSRFSPNYLTSNHTASNFKIEDYISLENSIITKKTIIKTTEEYSFEESI